MHASLKKKKRIHSCLNTELTLRHKKADTLSWGVCVVSGFESRQGSHSGFPRPEAGPGTHGGEGAALLGRRRGGAGCPGQRILPAPQEEETGASLNPRSIPPCCSSAVCGAQQAFPQCRSGPRSGEYGRVRHHGALVDTGQRIQGSGWDTPSPSSCLVARSCPIL